MAIRSSRDQIATLVRDTTREIREVTGLGGADDPATKAAGSALARAIRKQLSRRAAVVRRTFGGEEQRTEASAPGESPRRRTGALLRSVGQEVVGGIRRVGVARFVGRLLEEGVDSTAAVTPSGRAVGDARKDRKTGIVGRKRRRRGGEARRLVRIAPRPFMEKALADALPKMEGEAVGALQSRSRGAR